MHVAYAECSIEASYAEYHGSVKVSRIKYTKIIKLAKISGALAAHGFHVGGA
jgi:hypothetical protein